MKKVTKVLALVLALVLVIGVVPVQAASSVSLKKSSKVLYLGGCIGKKANGKKASYYSFLKVKKFLKNFDSTTMDVKLESEDPSIASVSNKTVKITAKKRGTTEVIVTVRNKKTEQTIKSMTLEIIVKKNSDKNFEVSGITDGKEYKVGDKITVKMPRTNDDDYRRLTCSSSDVKLDKTGSYGSEYTVTFKKAGTYTIKAETYQTSTYKGTIYSKSFNVTVKGEEKPEPTATPTPVAAEKLTAKQIALDTVEIAGFASPADIKAADIEIYYEIADTKIDWSLIKEVKAEGDNVIVTMYSDFTGDLEYKVGKKGDKDIQPGSFKAITATEKDIASIGVTTNKVLVDEITKVDIKYYNKDKIDITKNVEGKVFPNITLISDTYDAYASGDQVCLLKANIAAKFEISVYIGQDDRGEAIYRKGDFTVVSYQPQPQGFIYTVKEDNGTYLKETDTLSTSFALNATNPVIEVLFKYVDATGKVAYKTLAEEGITKIEPADKTVLFMGGQSATGGYYLKPNKSGTTSLLFYKGDNIVPNVTAKITVLGEAKASAVTATLSKSTLNVNAMLGDKLEIKVSVKDQYGKELKDQPITIEQTEQTKNSTGIANFGSFIDGVLVVNGSDIVLNSGRTQGTISAVIKSGSGQYTVSFNVANVDSATTAVLKSNPEQSSVTLKTGIKAGDVKPETFTISIQSVNGAYTVKNENMRLYTKQVQNPIKSSDLGVADGTTVYLYTIRFTGKDGQTKFLTAPSALITDGVTEVIFKAYDLQAKLDEGTYIVQAYKVVTGASNSTISAIGQRTISVVNDQPAVAYKQVKFTSTMLDGVDVVKECFEFYIDGKKLETLDIPAVEMNKAADGTKFVKKVTLRIHNDVYGDCDYNISTLDSKTIS